MIAILSDLYHSMVHSKLMCAGYCYSVASFVPIHHLR